MQQPSHMDVKPDMQQLQQAHMVAMQQQAAQQGQYPFGYGIPGMNNSSPLMASPVSSMGSPGSGELTRRLLLYCVSSEA